jgi:hypothetical protein
MPRFAILEHDHPHLHWDLLLSCGQTLRTWRLAEPPAAQVPVAAEALPDHRPVYLEYEGPISGGRGRVLRWDTGTFTWEEAGAAGRVVVHLTGSRLRGTLTLVQTDGAAWLASFQPEDA